MRVGDVGCRLSPWARGGARIGPLCLGLFLARGGFGGASSGALPHSDGCGEGSSSSDSSLTMSALAASGGAASLVRPSSEEQGERCSRRRRARERVRLLEGMRAAALVGSTKQKPGWRKCYGHTNLLGRVRSRSNSMGCGMQRDRALQNGYIATLTMIMWFLRASYGAYGDK